MAHVTMFDDPEDVLALLPYVCAYTAGRGRVITKRLLRQVKQLANIRVCGRKEEARLGFYSDWQRRLLSAGIDPDTFKVVDEVRWAHAWDQLRVEGVYREKEQMRRVVSKSKPIDFPPKAYLAPTRETVKPEKTVADVSVTNAVSRFVEAKRSGFKQSL